MDLGRICNDSLASLNLRRQVLEHIDGVGASRWFGGPRHALCVGWVARGDLRERRRESEVALQSFQAGPVRSSGVGVAARWTVNGAASWRDPEVTHERWPKVRAGRKA
jgi:hypothetical protein